jgi:hypothetical protein
MLEYHEVDYTQLGHQLAGKPRQQFQIFAHLRGQADERVISSGFERRQQRHERKLICRPSGGGA